MIKVKFGYKVWAVITFIVVSLAVLLSGFDTSRVDADTNDSKYIVYIYDTGEIDDYELDAVPTYNAYSLMTRNISTYSSRPNAPVDTAIVYIGGATGFIIGDHEIMTASHVVFKNWAFAESLDLKIHLQNPTNSSSSEFISLTEVACHIPNEMYTQTNAYLNYDYAIITVEEDLSNYGCFYLGIPDDNIITNTVPIHVRGYYSENNNIALKSSCGAMEGLSYTQGITSITDTTNGTSGAPAFVQSCFGVPGVSTGEFAMQTYRTVVGVHSGRNLQGKERLSLVTPEVLKFVYDNENLNMGMPMSNE